MPPVRRRLFVCTVPFILLFITNLFACQALAQKQPWDGPAFTGTPSAIVDAAKLPASSTSDSIVLLQENRFKFDEQGRRVQKYHVVVKILSPAGVDQWKSLEADYEPWHEQRPQLEARVISSGNVVHNLDQKTIAEAPVQDEDEDIYSDGRVVRAPIPALEPGVVLEELVTYSENTALFESGSIHRVYVGMLIPVQQTRLFIEAPTSLPLKYEAMLLPHISVEKKEVAGVNSLLFEQGALDAMEKSEPFQPFDVPPWPQISFSLGKSWKDVATTYSRAVDEKISSADVKKFVETATKAGPDRMAIINSLIDQLHSEVRYTGVEFGQSALIPHTPAETLKHKFGDCKDKASLLVAMLRGAGIPAYLSLLSTGPGLDTPKGLAGMGTFDHAIVYVPGSPDLWIDATAEFLKAGELPSADQGRLALVVRPETDGLVLIPELPSFTNRVVETREFFLPEQGSARVVETTETFGPITANYRHSYGGAETKELHKQLEEYVQNTYLAEKLNKYEHGKAEEKSKPFFIRLEAEKAKRGNVDENEAVVATPMGAIFERLPQSLREDDGEPSESDAKTPNNKYKIRKQDLVLPTPFVTEWHYRIVPSQGYKLRALPKDETVFFGPAKLTREYSQNADNTVQAVFRFDTMKRRWSADEVESARKAIRELGKKDVPLIYFDQAGHVALQAGKVREALDIYANLSSLHPTEALHHSQAARAYLVAGLGESAREEAERAVKLEPTSAKAYKTLGWILEHDLVGRRLQKGFDLKGAVAAFRKAKQLDPDDITIPTDLAILLEYDSEGIRYSQKADLNGAIAEYAGMKDKLEKAGVIDNPLWTLAWAGRFKELKEKTDSLPSSPTRVAFSLVATAALEGSASALKEATRITADDKARSTALIGAADQLLRIRKYQEAADLMAAGAQGSEQAASQVARAELLRKTKHYEDALYPESDPRRAVQLYLVKTFHGAPGTEVAGLLSHFSYSENAKKKAKAIKDLGEASRVIHNQLLQTGSSMDTLTDIVTSLMQFSSEGDDKTGYRLRGQSPGAPTQTFYVVKENDGYKLLGITPDDSQAVGSYILWKLIDSDVDASRRWLDWIREVEKRGGGDDAFSGKAFPHFWTKGQQADKDKIRYAAAALTSAGEDPELAVPVLLEGRSKATTDTERRDFDFALAQAYQTLRKYEELLIVSRRMAEGDKSSVRAFDFQCNALRGLKKFSEAEQLAEMRLKEIPDDLDAIHSIMRTAVFAGQPKKTVELAHGIIASGKAVAGDFNEESWFALVAESDIAAAIETARKGVSMTQNKSAGILHTLAALYAEHGDTKESREVILQTMTAWALDEPNSQSWYVFGRIAEQYGASEAAAKAYKRVEAPEVDEAIPGSTYQLAQRRLAFLNKKDTAGQD